MILLRRLFQQFFHSPLDFFLPPLKSAPLNLSEQQGSIYSYFFS